ncbi:hypothetical protein DRN73_10155 [Candidatus Pacearchaeota archaeon]|nr:MAG: hypothetical protein DRN73_10155 [Candidatus Pacearchaeota archaeon]
MTIAPEWLKNFQEKLALFPVISARLNVKKEKKEIKTMEDKLEEMEKAIKEGDEKEFMSAMKEEFKTINEFLPHFHKMILFQLKFLDKIHRIIKKIADEEIKAKEAGLSDEDIKKIKSFSKSTLSKEREEIQKIIQFFGVELKEINEEEKELEKV